MARPTFRNLFFILVASVALGCLPNSGYAQRGGGRFHGGGGGFHGRGGGFGGVSRGGLQGGGFRGVGSFNRGAYRGMARGPSIVGPSSRPGGYGYHAYGGYRNSGNGSQRWAGSIRTRPAGAPLSSAPRIAANSDGQWHFFAGSRGGYHPLHAQGRAPRLLDFHRHLVVTAANTAALKFHNRGHVLQGDIKNFAAVSVA